LTIHAGHNSISSRTYNMSYSTYPLIIMQVSLPFSTNISPLILPLSLFYTKLHVVTVYYMSSWDHRSFRLAWRRSPLVRIRISNRRKLQLSSWRDGSCVEVLGWLSTTAVPPHGSLKAQHYPHKIRILHSKQTSKTHPLCRRTFTPHE
ncbi:unnamed protein product, partial [Ectocarpus sp. 13 AM-2016]